MPVALNTVFVDQIAPISSTSLEETFRMVAEDQAAACLCLDHPTPEELGDVAVAFGLHELAVEDSAHGHQRPKLERYGDTLFTVLRPALYVDADEVVRFGEIHAFVGPRFFVAVVKEDPRGSVAITTALTRLAHKSGLVGAGPQAQLWALFDSIVDGYRPVADGLEEDINQIEDQLFAGVANTSRRIYELFGEVVDFQRATRPLVAMLEALHRGADKYHMPLELQRRFRDVLDHVIRITDRADTFRALLQNALTVDATLAAQKQNDDTKRISAWAAILFAPTLIAAIYGMNFTNMPELHWRYGYPLSIVAMVVFAVVLFVVFKVKRWF
ncbi:transporter [Curtobacterium sp. MCBD17_013]|uniref:magnesium and cobalt transport protein CorA n=1 Tax=unclassified Curtobacterium TaxID=257496 RepID=UPI000DA93935|nr:MULTISPECIES: magnesium and cobalt transport protein CorA [unclassified Curtobacterium]PZF63276.1 transporter [Curtobacterium sp. MCBD17_013]WIB64307.1 magnesium and cobalt transport protein CorA [Curtobacterium sp. MCBD17_040]WIB68168.1 magnesium and cobalt transport protein CorA [Curtobacterium sp. MCBD17_035]